MVHSPISLDRGVDGHLGHFRTAKKYPKQMTSCQSMLCKALFLSNCTSHFAHPSIKRMYKQTNAEEFQQDTTRANVVLTCLIRIDNNSGSLFQGQDFGSKNTR